MHISWNSTPVVPHRLRYNATSLLKGKGIIFNLPFWEKDRKKWLSLLLGPNMVPRLLLQMQMVLTSSQDIMHMRTYNSWVIGKMHIYTFSSYSCTYRVLYFQILNMCSSIKGCTECFLINAFKLMRCTKCPACSMFWWKEPKIFNPNKFIKQWRQMCVFNFPPTHRINVINCPRLMN